MVEQGPGSGAPDDAGLAEERDRTGQGEATTALATRTALSSLTLLFADEDCEDLESGLKRSPLPFE